MAIESAQRTTPVPSPGPPTSPIALNGAYWVQPPRVGPVPTKNEDTKTRKPTNVTQNDIMLKCGNGMSSAPTWGQEIITECREWSRREHEKDHDGGMHGHQLQVKLRRH